MSGLVARWQAPRTSRPVVWAVVLGHVALLWALLTVWGPAIFQTAQAPVLALLLPEPVTPPLVKAPLVVPARPVPRAAPPEPERPQPALPDKSPAVSAPVLSSPAPTPSPMAVTSPAPLPASPVPLVSGPPVAAPTAPVPVARTAAALSASHRCEEPAYPQTSSRLEEEGSVVLRFLVQADGLVSDSQIETSSGFRRLDEAARQALARCQFKPATVDGKPEQSWVSLRYTWRIKR